MVWYLKPKHLNYSFINKNVVSLTALQIAANGDGGLIWIIYLKRWIYKKSANMIQEITK